MTQEEYEKYLSQNPCDGCPAYSGSDCTRNPYTEGCLDQVVEKYWQEHQI